MTTRGTPSTTSGAGAVAVAAAATAASVAAPLAYDDELVSISSQLEYIVTGTRRPKDIALLVDDERHGVLVLHASDYPVAEHAVVVFDVGVWKAMQAVAPTRVSAVYFCIDPVLSTAALFVDVIPKTGMVSKPVPLFAPTSLPSNPPPPPSRAMWDTVRQQTANDTHCSLVMAIANTLNQSLLGWMCISPVGRTGRMSSDSIEMDVLPVAGSSHVQGTALLVARVTISPADGTCVISSRTIDAIRAIGQPTSAVSVSRVAISRSDSGLGAHTIAFHIIVSVVQADEAHWTGAPAASLSTAAAPSLKRRRSHHAPVATSALTGTATTYGASAAAAAYNSADDEQDGGGGGNDDNDDDDDDAIRRRDRIKRARHV